MIAVQPISYQNKSLLQIQSTFKGNDDAELSDLKKQERDLRGLAEDRNSPKIFSFIAKGAVVIASAILGGATMKVGLEKSFDIFSKFFKSKSMVAFNKKISRLLQRTKAESKTFRNSEFARKMDSDFGISKLVNKIKANPDYIKGQKYVKENLLDKQKLKTGFINVTSGASAIAGGATGAARINEKSESTKDYSRKSYFDNDSYDEDEE